MTIREKIEHLQMARDAVFRAIYHLDAIGARKTSDELVHLWLLDRNRMVQSNPRLLSGCTTRLWVEIVIPL